MGWRSCSISEAQCVYYAVLEQRRGVIVSLNKEAGLAYLCRGAHCRALSSGHSCLGRANTLAGISAYTVTINIHPSTIPARPESLGSLTWQCPCQPHVFAQDSSHSLPWVPPASVVRNADARAGQVHADSEQQDQKFCMFN